MRLQEAADILLKDTRAFKAHAYRLSWRPSNRNQIILEDGALKRVMMPASGTSMRVVPFHPSSDERAATDWTVAEYS